MIKKILSVFFGVIVLLTFVSCNKNDVKAGENQTEIQEIVKYNTAEELAEKFMEVSRAGDIEGMHKLYYNDMLAKFHETISDKVSREEFDALISEEMKGFVDYELFMYGGAELLPSAPPAYYVNYFYYLSTGTEANLNDDLISDCANIRVYSALKKTDHMLAKVDGSWYVIY